MLTRIRVAEVVFSLDYGKFGGGAERFALSLAQQLDTNRFEVVVCALWRVGTLSEERNANKLLSCGIEPVILGDWNDALPEVSFWTSFRSFWGFVAARNIHILHSHSQFGDIMLLLLKLFRKANVVIRTIHDGYPKEWRKRILRRLLLTNFLYPIIFDAEIGVNDHIVNRLNKRYIARILKRRAMCIYNGIDIDRFRTFENNRDILRNSLGFKPDEFLIGTISRLTIGKGIETFIGAIPEVLSSVPYARFLLVGDGPDADLLRRLAYQLGVENYIIFAGARLDVENLLECMDLFVLPSLWEGLSTTVLESMAAGTPVVVTNVPGNVILVQNRVNGWVVPPSDVSALARAIVEAAQNPQLRNRFAHNAWKAVERFSINKAVEEHEKLYLSLMEDRRPYGKIPTQSTPVSMT
ncbi:glycosyltransferase family 4 protein [Thermanaerothrix sp.]|uniref:glycosyltransferase family 4 protein n=1 Tax=Thermanaerothrix sp. TaxID=2972675 RepID=UPI003C7A92C5